MKIITVKATLIASPEPPFVGTRLRIRISEAGQTFGIYGAELAEGTQSATVRWGDGTSETLAEISQKTHAYATPGEYEIQLSDDISSLNVCDKTSGSPYCEVYPKLIVRIASDARQLTTIGSSGFIHCTNLSSFDLGDSAIQTLSFRVFYDCPSLAEYRLPVGLSSLGKDAFGNCTRLCTVNLPHGVELLQASVFRNCSSLNGEILLPFISDIRSAASNEPFVGCPGITVFHFAEANEGAIQWSTGYRSDPTLGTGSAVCVFDL